MKLRITRSQLNELSDEQKQNLCDLWLPHVYDVAVANVCVDAAEEKYEQLTYVIGSIELLRHHSMLLFDLKFLPDDQLQISEEETPSDGIESDRIDGLNIYKEDKDSQSSDLEVEESFDELDEDFSFEFQRPVSYVKEDCIPLLDIGQMIDILERKNFGQGDFYLTATIGDFVCDLGKNDFNTDNYDPNNKNSELCDILWESIKALI